MSTLTLRLPDKVINQTELSAKKLNISRSEYIRRCIEKMNAELYENEKRKKLIDASKRVRGESMVVNAEFAEVEHDPKA